MLKLRESEVVSLYIVYYVCVQREYSEQCVGHNKLLFYPKALGGGGGYSATFMLFNVGSKFVRRNMQSHSNLSEKGVKELPFHWK